MNVHNLFPLIAPKKKFREQLKNEILDVYEKQTRPRFDWRWLLAPGLALTSMLLVLVATDTKQFSHLSEFVIPTQRSKTAEQAKQQRIDQTETKPVEQPENLDQLDHDLTELSSSLDNDTDINAAVSFTNL